RVDCDVPSRAAAFVKLLSSATAMNHSMSLRSRRSIRASARFISHIDRFMRIAQSNPCASHPLFSGQHARGACAVRTRLRVPGQARTNFRNLGMDTSYDSRLAGTTNAWGAVICLSLFAFVLVASEFMPVSLLTPIAGELGISEGQAGQAIAISGLFAVLTSLFGNSLLARLDRRTVVF